MILCVVDDLMFSVKISSAAKAVGAPLVFERKAENVLPAIREQRPALVIFDLNSNRLHPMEAIAAMKQDAELRTIATLGYASHVQVDAIEAARAAGIDQVLARSAFVQHLGDILTRASKPGPTA